MLISLAFRPELYLALRPTDRRAVASALQRDLRHSLSHCLRTLDENGNVVDLADQLDPSYRLSDPPKPAQVREFVAVLKASTPSETSHTSTEFEEWIELLLGRLGFESIYALCDGIDAFPETAAARTDVADAWLAPLLDHVETWAGRRVYLKAFLPIELESYWRTHHLRRTSSLPGFRLDWTVERLSQAIRKRIEVASEGKFDSLDAISSTAIRDLETLLASQVPPLPREVLWVARETLRAFSQRVGGRVGSALEPEDVAAGLAAYRQQRSGSLFGQLGDRLPPALPQQGALTTVSL
ncbi:MAG: hypothetical protein M1546_02275 [Chloroflexi bacterium]|nr:hypothetical protein [Chloroflexota bacterium]